MTIGELNLSASSPDSCNGFSISVHIPDAKRIRQIKNMGKKGSREIKFSQEGSKGGGLDLLFSLDIRKEEQVKILYE